MTLTVPPTTPGMQTLACTAVPAIASAELPSPNQVIGAGSPGVGQTSESPARDYLPLVRCLVLSLCVAKRCVEQLLESKRDLSHFEGGLHPFPGKYRRLHRCRSNHPRSLRHERISLNSRILGLSRSKVMLTVQFRLRCCSDQMVTAEGARLAV